MHKHEFSEYLLADKQALIYVEVYKGEGNWYAFEGALRSESAVNYLRSMLDEMGYRIEPKYPRVKS